MKGTRGATLLALVVAASGLATAPGHATTVTTLYVQSGQPGVTCSDAGSGTSAMPYCTISKAASVVQAGQTVSVGFGYYPEAVTITAHGTASAPIRFVGQSNVRSPLATWVGSSGGPVAGDHAFVLSGAQYVWLTGFTTSGNKEPVLVQNSQHIVLDQFTDANSPGNDPTLRVAGSSNVSASHGVFPNGIELDAGTSGTSIENDVLLNGSFGTGTTSPALLATGAAGTTIVNDTFTPPCGQAIDLEGASTGATIENDVINTSAGANGSSGGTCGTDNTAITVAHDAMSGAKSDYNVLFTGAGAGGLYAWDGTTYTGLPTFTTATGQGGHDLAQDPKLVPALGGASATYTIPVYPSEHAPEVDSADAGAAPSSDILSLVRVDDPLVANTGAGTVHYADRGAYEFQDPIKLATTTVTHAPGGGPLDVKISTGVTNAWSTNISYLYRFNDGSPDFNTTSSTIVHDYNVAGPATVDISAADTFGVTPSDQNSFDGQFLGADYTPLAPVRVLDTRHAIGVPTTTPVPANWDVMLTVAGLTGIPNGNGLSAVVLNVTATAPTAGGYLTVYPYGSPVPVTSNLNFSPGQTVPNLVTVRVHDGKIRFHNGSGGTVHMVADVEGYYADSGYGFKSQSPVRVLDTRHGTGVPASAPVPANGILHLDLSSKVPSGTKAVTLNVTVTRPAAGGYLTVYPDGQPAPLASNLNFSAGQTVPNLVTVPVTNGKVDFENGSGGAVDLVADLAGYYGGPATGATFGFMPDPSRVIDTRTAGNGPIAANTALDVGSGLFPSLTSEPAPGTGVLANVTVTRPAAGGYLTVYPDGHSTPLASNLNFSAGQTVANLTSTVFGSNGIDVFNGSSGRVDVIVDLEGYFVPPFV